MKTLPREPSHRFGQAKRSYCLICSQETKLQSYVYLPIRDALKLVNLCVLHDNSHRIVGNEKPIYNGCAVISCLEPHKSKGYCRYHYQRLTQFGRDRVEN